MSDLHIHLAKWLVKHAEDLSQDEATMRTIERLQNSEITSLKGFIDCLRDGRFLCRVLKAIDKTVIDEIDQRYIHRFHNSERVKADVSHYNIR